MPAATTTVAASASTILKVQGATVPLRARVTSSAGSVNEGGVSFQIMNGAATMGLPVTSAIVSGGGASADYVLPPNTPSGVYSIAAKFENAADFADSSDATQTLTVTGPAFQSAASAAPNPGEVGQSIVFTAPATDAFDNSLIYAWAFGDGSAGDSAVATHSFSAPGVYSATVTVTDGDGAAIRSNVMVSVGEAGGIFSLHGKLNLGGAHGDAATLLALIKADHGTSFAGNQITVAIGGLTRSFIVGESGFAHSGDNTIHLRFTNFPRDGIPTARILLKINGAVKAQIFSGLALDATGYPAGLPVQFLINSNFKGGFYPVKFRRRGKLDVGQFGSN